MPQIRFALSRGFAIGGQFFLAINPGRRAPRVALYPYMFSSMPDFSSLLCFVESPLGGLWNEDERSESSGTTRPAAAGGSICLVGVQLPAAFRCCFGFPLLFSLLRQGTEAGAPYGAPAVCASSFSPRTVCSQSVAQLEPRTSSAPNSNRCLNCGPGHKFACIRLSQITLTRH